MRTAGLIPHCAGQYNNNENLLIITNFAIVLITMCVAKLVYYSHILLII
jgi:hypothetical protein